MNNYRITKMTMRRNEKHYAEEDEYAKEIYINKKKRKYKTYTELNNKYYYNKKIHY